MIRFQNTKTVAFTVMNLLISSEVFAVCENEPMNRYNKPNITQCATAAATTAATVTTGIYAAKKFMNADSIDKSFTNKLFDSAPTALSDEAINTMAKDTGEGDRVRLTYHLSEKENRLLHLRNIQSEIDSAKSSAKNYRALAVAALVPKPEYDEKGKFKGMSSPDYASNLLYNNMAESAEADATKHAKWYGEVKRGAKVPFIDINEELVVDGKVSFGRGAPWKQMAETLQSKIKAGGKILHVDRLPSAIYKKISSMKIKGGVAVVLTLAGGALVLEELYKGAGAEVVEDNIYQPVAQ